MEARGWRRGLQLSSDDRVSTSVKSARPSWLLLVGGAFQASHRRLRRFRSGQPVGGTDTLFTDLTLKMLLSQSGAKLSGSVHRYITTWDNHGVFLYVDVDAGTPGKLTGTVGGSGIAVAVRDLGETKISASWGFTLSADGHTLTNQGTGPAAFIR